MVVIRNVYHVLVGKPEKRAHKGLGTGGRILK
jgi:hypothetical protein